MPRRGTRLFICVAVLLRQFPYTGTVTPPTVIQLLVLNVETTLHIFHDFALVGKSENKNFVCNCVIFQLLFYRLLIVLFLQLSLSKAGMGLVSERATCSMHSVNNIWRLLFILTIEFCFSDREWVSVFNSCNRKKIPRWAFSSSASLATDCTFHTLFGSKEKQLAMFCKLAKLKMINRHIQTEKTAEMHVIQHWLFMLE